MKCGGKPGGGNDARRKSLRDSLRAWKSLRDSHIPTARLLLYILKTYFRKEPSSPPAPFPFRLILGLEKTGTQKATLNIHSGTDGGFAETNTTRRFRLLIWKMI